MNRRPSSPIRKLRRCSPFVYLLLLVAIVAPTPDLLAQWVGFHNETSQRSDVSSALFADDPDEKDYAWGDLDRDGDVDLVIARKQPFTTAGKRVNVLMLNLGGVLTDRTADFATDADIPGDQGFLTPTNDRDIAMVDVNGDRWLDVITSAAIAMDGDPKHIGYPRVYINKCCAVGGCEAETCSTDDWLGLRFEDARMPLMLTDDGQAGVNPCFCAVSAGDVTGDGYPDLYFSDYDSSCGTSGGPLDYNDKLLVNQGDQNPGFFADVTETNFIDLASGFPISAFGASGGIGKFNQDEHNDILKQSETVVRIAYNMPTNPGTFDKANTPIQNAVYFVNHGDLNNDGDLDLVVSDDGADRFLLNQGDNDDGMAEFLSFTFSFSHTGSGGPAGDDGFGGNNLIADLNNDGHNDVLITDVDVNNPASGSRMHIYKNLGGPPGGNRVIEEQTSGSGCQNLFGNPPTCMVTTIPASQLKDTHDVAVFDIDGDGLKDMVVGRCSGTEVYRNVPLAAGAGSTPDGDVIPGTMLILERDGDQINLSWGESCSIWDDDYSVYQGVMGDFESHLQLICSTSGWTAAAVVAWGPSAYYLVAPRNETFQGSLGLTSAGVQRYTGISPCLPTQINSCE